MNKGVNIFTGGIKGPVTFKAVKKRCGMGFPMFDLEYRRYVY